MKYNNSISIVGTVRELSFDHSNSKTNMYRMLITTDRLSGVSDEIRVNIEEYLLGCHDIKVGSRIQVDGIIRTYRKDSHLILVVIAKNIVTVDVPKQDRNVASIEGFVCKPPVFRETPFGKHIIDLHIAHNTDSGVSSYIPCIVWNKLAMLYKDISVGQGVSITGRLQSRKYNKVIEDTVVEKTVNELSIISLKPLQENDI